MSLSKESALEEPCAWPVHSAAGAKLVNSARCKLGVHSAHPLCSSTTGPEWTSVLLLGAGTFAGQRQNE